MKRLAFLIIFLLFIPGVILPQDLRHTWEVIFQADNLSAEETCDVSMTASGALTRWLVSGGYKLPTSSCSSVSDDFPGNGNCGWDAPDDGEELAWGKYQVSFECTDSFDRTFYLDLRDADWTQGLGYINPDITITYYPDNGDNYKLMAQISGESPEYITSNEVVEVWELGDKVQNQEDLLVPVTATNNWSGGNVKMAGTIYSAPHTLNWGWTTTHAIEAITPQTVEDIIHTFSQWSDAVGTNPRNVTIDDSHDSYSFTANFTNKPVTPDNFSGTTYNYHPKLSWDALTGSTISGYKVYRDYNKGGWQFVTNVTPKEEDDWVDNNYTTSGSPLYITKYRITSYTSSA